MGHKTEQEGPFLLRGTIKIRASDATRATFQTVSLKLSEKSSPGSELKPHKSTKRSKKPNLGASGTKNVGFSGYSRPLSDSFSRHLGEYPLADVPGFYRWHHG